MVPGDFRDFFTASASAGAALLGLLFVAVSISAERIFGRMATPERRAVASSAFTALVNAFFISIGALLPGASLGFIVLFFGAISVFNTVVVGVQLLQGQWRNRAKLSRAQLGLRIARGLAVVVISLGVYGYETICGRELVMSVRPSVVSTLGTMLLVVYGIGVVRAWELLGAIPVGLLRWLNPLEGLDDQE